MKSIMKFAEIRLESLLFFYMAGQAADAILLNVDFLTLPTIELF